MRSEFNQRFGYTDTRPIASPQDLPFDEVHHSGHELIHKMKNKHRSSISCQEKTPSKFITEMAKEPNFSDKDNCLIVL